MIKNQPNFKFLFLIIDIFALSLCGVFIRFNIIRKISDESQIRLIIFFIYYFIPFIIITLYLFYYFGLYKRNNILVVYHQIILICKALLISAIFSIIILLLFYTNELLVPHKKYILIYTFILSLIFLVIVRVFIARSIFIFLIKKAGLKSKILIVGGGEPGIYAGKSLENSIYSDFQIVGYIDDYKEVGSTIYNNHINLGNFGYMDGVIDSYQIDEILIAIDNIDYDTMIYIVQRCLEFNKTVRIYSNLFRILEEKLNVELYGGIPVIMLSEYNLSVGVRFFKRLIDILLSLSVLIILIPLFAVISIGIKLSSKGPIFFAQKRIGKNGKAINFYKFRSMHIAESNEEHKKFVLNLIKKETKSDEIRVFKITDDPRIFKFGKIIRKTGIDELPQLYNVIKGEMSIVGPRPCLPYEWECYNDWHKKRANALPGCTGLWHIVGRSAVTFEEMVLLDLYYISNISIMFDFKIMFKTFPVIFLGKNRQLDRNRGIG
jgi:exopolysaccharide biosynthesis polyprenyl glycosylphosphotransferase